MQHIHNLWILSSREYRHDAVFQRLSLTLALSVYGLFISLFLFQVATCLQTSSDSPVSLAAIHALATLARCLILVFAAGYVLVTLLRLVCSRDARHLLSLLGYGYADCLFYSTCYWLAILVKRLLILDILTILICLLLSFYPMPVSIPLLQIGLTAIAVSNAATILSAIVLHAAVIAFSR